MPIVGYETDSVFEFVPCQEKIKPWGSAMYFYIALSTWLPLLFISIGNVLLIIRMRKSYKIHNELTRKSSSCEIYLLSLFKRVYTYIIVILRIS